MIYSYVSSQFQFMETPEICFQTSEKIVMVLMMIKDSNIHKYTIEVFLNAFAKGLAKLLPKTLCDGIMNKDMNK